MSISILHSQSDLTKKIAHTLKIKEEDIKAYKIRRQSLDARKKQDILYSYNIDVELENEDKVLKKNASNKQIQKAADVIYSIKVSGDEFLEERLVVVGFGPAGIFAALALAKAGFKPLVIERGEDVDNRSISVERFWKTGILNEESNVSFGEGGAGTFSDGKLNTMVKDTSGRNTFVLETFVKHGADERILYDYKPHIGTDKLKEVVKSIREEIIALGGEIRFNTCMKSIVFNEAGLCGIELRNGELIKTGLAVLACGHSARDVFTMLKEKNVHMEAKNFAVGLRMIHSQEMIDKAQYGEKYFKQLSPAPYKLTYTTKSGRGVYSFCMCPGGYVVNASNYENKLAVNGMSYNDRSSTTANSAIIVTVNMDDFQKETGTNDILAGVAFQEKLEKLAYEAGQAKIPVQLYRDFVKGKISEGFGEVEANIKGEHTFTDINEILPEYITDAIKEAIPEFDKKIKGFACDDAILLAVESRTSSPVRIKRDEELRSHIKGLYPCGEGAGYAGGITSAAMDGLKVAEAICKKYKNRP